MRVLLVDDQRLFREAVALLLRSILGDVEVAEAGNGEEAIALAFQSGCFDLALVDLNLLGSSGLDLIGSLRECWPQSSILALSSSDDPVSVLQALDAGAMGFIAKSGSSTQFAEALGLVMSKGISLPPTVLSSSGVKSGMGSRAEPGSASARAHTSPAELGLTPRQTEVLYLVLQGKPVKLIAQELGLSSSTIKAHISAALRALNVTTRTQAIVVAAKLGLVFEPASARTLSTA